MSRAHTPLRAPASHTSAVLRSEPSRASPRTPVSLRAPPRTTWSEGLCALANQRRGWPRPDDCARVNSQNGNRIEKSAARPLWEESRQPVEKREGPGGRRGEKSAEKSRDETKGPAGSLCEERGFGVFRGLLPRFTDHRLRSAAQEQPPRADCTRPMSQSPSVAKQVSGDAGAPTQ